MVKAKIKLKTKQFSIPRPRDKFLWHVFSTKKIFKLDSFLSGELYLARLDTFKDPLEGSLPRRNRSLLDKAPEYAKKYIIDAYAQAVRQSFATCWHRNPNEPSNYMWEQFGDRHDGIAIRTDAKQMLSAAVPFLKLGAAHFGGIKYIDHRRALIRTKNILRAQFVVRLKYKEEKEARLLLHTYGPFGSTLVAYQGPRGLLVRARRTKTTPPRREFVGGYKRGKAVVVGIEPKAFIKEIVVGKRVVDSIFQTVSQRAAALGISCRRVR
jgi:hypothetical protein